MELVKANLHQMTLAVGDGANDVSMIQMADVGVGVAGKEGMQVSRRPLNQYLMFHHISELVRESLPEP